MFLLSRLNISLSFFMPSSSRYLIFMFCLSSSFFFRFSDIFFMASCFSFGMYFEIIFSSSFILSIKDGRFSKSLRIFSFIFSSSLSRICLKAMLIAWVCLNFCMTSFFSFDVTRLSERWAWLPSIFRTLQTICLFGTTYCRISLIRPGAISDEIIVPSSPSGISTDVIVFVTSFTLHNIKSPSSILMLMSLLI